MQWSVSSPNQLVSLLVMQERDGSLRYKVSHQSDGTTADVILPSRLGIVRDDQAFAENLTFESADPQVTIDETYEMLIGKQRLLHNHANELTLNFRNANGARLQVVLRAYDDGAAFRYRFPEQDAESHTVTQELTTFKVAMEGRMWASPYDHATMYAPAYERYFTNGTPVGINARRIGGTGWAFPALFQIDQHWLLITEADLTGTYFGAHLGAEPEEGEYEIAMPFAEEGQETGMIEPTAALPWEMPWRVIMVGDSAGDILESSLVYHLSAPNQLADTSWIQPGRASWSWWSDHPSSKEYDKLAHFVDLAAEMGWEYSLVDANWNIMSGGDLEQLAAYAKEKGVGLLVWYNSGGAHNIVTEQPRDRMEERETRRKEFAWLESLGIRGVKIDFFQSDKPHIIQLYLDILEDAADFHLLVNFHGSTLPRGWSRTYPHLMSMEGVRGAESYTFDNTYSENAPVLNTILPFTRNTVGPMDYTPVSFTDELVPHVTTNAHELALAVVFESGILHFADSVEAYRALPDAPKAFLRVVPAVWDQTRYLAGVPGQYVVVARRSGEAWYVGGISARDEVQDITLDWAFLGDDVMTMTLIKDGKDRLSFETESGDVNTGAPMNLTLPPHGGFVMKIEKKG